VAPVCHCHHCSHTHQCQHVSWEAIVLYNLCLPEFHYLFPELDTGLYPLPYKPIPQHPAIPSLCCNICLYTIILSTYRTSKQSLPFSVTKIFVHIFHLSHVRYMFKHLILLELIILVIPDEVAHYAVFFSRSLSFLLQLHALTCPH
jgi:hypothetical protein